ncbi:MAG: tRNA (guanosine(37)-N1)-methyltransferase TrmD [Patescibacteria group bacterium]
MLTFHIITLFPNSFDSYLSESIIARAIKNKKIRVKFYNPRDYVRASKTNYKRVDERAYGGGPGMVMQAEPVLKIISKIKKQISKNKKAKSQTIFFSPDGEQFSNKLAENFAKKLENIILICGRYEGVDERVVKISKAKKVSVGPYTLTGGELPAMVVLDTTARRLPGVLGKMSSVEENRASSHAVYTRPEVLKYQGKNYKVPKVLLSGNHAEIDKWREKR